MYVCMPPRGSMRPMGIPVCFTPDQQQLPGAEASVGNIVEIVWRADNGDLVGSPDMPFKLWRHAQNPLEVVRETRDTG